MKGNYLQLLCLVTEIPYPNVTELGCAAAASLFLQDEDDALLILPVQFPVR